MTGHVSHPPVPSARYITFPPSAGEPPGQLKGFQKVHIAAGASARVTIPLRERDFSVWDPVAHAWKKVPGTFAVGAGASSADIRLKASIVVQK